VKKTQFFRINQRIDEKLLAAFVKFLEKIKKYPDTEFVYLMFDTKGGELSSAVKIIKLINKSEIKFVGIAYGAVHSAAIPIFLSTHIRIGYKGSSALIHRAKKVDSKISNIKMGTIEKQIFEIISEKISIPLKKVYKMADERTYLTMEHPLGKRFFIGH